MRRWLAIAALLGGCSYFGDDSESIDPAPDGPPPTHEVPPGVWEPVPGAWIVYANLAADNGAVWWVFTRKPERTVVWLGETSSTGTSIVAPTEVGATSALAYGPDLVITPSAVVAQFNGTLLRRYDHAGRPLGDPYPLVIADGAGPSFAQTDLVPTADGGAQFVAGLNDYELAETVIVNLDAGGTQTSTVFVGTPDTFESVRSSVYGVAAAARPDGSTLIAWDRNYVVCIPVRPSETLTSAVTGTTVGASQLVQDLPDVSETQPSIASSGDTAYITWRSDAANWYGIALAKFPDVGTALAEIGDPNENNYGAALTLAGPGRGAITYISGGSSGRINVVGFAESAGIVKLGVPRVMPRVDPDASAVPVGLVHVSGDRYVFAWIEHGDEARLYATEIDLGNEMMRPAPLFKPNPAPAARAPRKLPCP